MSKKSMLNEMKEKGYIIRENVTYKIWSGQASTETISDLYKNFLKWKKGGF